MPEPRGAPATVLIADDHTLFREGLAALISRWPDFELVGSAGDGHEAVRLSRRLQPQLILMDVRMPLLGGVEATRQIRIGQPATKVVMLTMSTLGEDVFEALRNGAHGFLSKDEPPDRLHDFLVDVLRGEVALSGAIAGKVLAEFGGIGPRATSGPSGGRESLSPRERDRAAAAGGRPVQRRDRASDVRLRGDREEAPRSGDDEVAPAQSRSGCGLQRAHRAGRLAQERAARFRRLRPPQAPYGTRRTRRGVSGRLPRCTRWVLVAPRAGPRRWTCPVACPRQRRVPT